ncbi:MAG: FKBP-type peptidyl-prolyl cis-trans isomerase [Candidatus Pacearchaeota archaeon]
MDTVKKNDFIEIEFTGYSNGEPFDTTDKEIAKKMGIDVDVKPIIISVGNEMLLKGFDEDLIGKEINKFYKIKLPPEKAFGRRDPNNIKVISLKVFNDKKINPYPGLTLQIDNYIAKVISVSGGRVNVDFNNPLAGKEVEYHYIIKRKINENTEKINALMDFFFKQRFNFIIEENKVIFKDEKINPLIEVMLEKFKNMTGLEFEINHTKK